MKNVYTVVVPSYTCESSYTCVCTHCFYSLWVKSVHKDVRTDHRNRVPQYHPCVHHLLDMYSSVCATGLGKPHIHVYTYVANVHTVHVVCQAHTRIFHFTSFQYPFESSIFLPFLSMTWLNDRLFWFVLLGKRTKIQNL